MRSHLLSNIDSVREKARLGSLGRRYSGSWLNVFPFKVHLKPPEFTFAACYRLGIEVFGNSGPCPVCSSHSDALGDHAISCGMAGERIARHNQLRDTIFQTAQRANLAPLKESRALLLGTDARPADILIPRWTEGRDTCYDVTVVNGLRQDLIERVAEEPAFAVQHVYASKWSKYGPQCEAEGLTFVPLPTDTFGAWHDLAAKHLRKLGSALSQATGTEESTIIKHIFERLSVLIVRGNMSLLLNRIPEVNEPQIDRVV